MSIGALLDVLLQQADGRAQALEALNSERYLQMQERLDAAHRSKWGVNGAENATRTHHPAETGSSVP